MRFVPERFLGGAMKTAVGTTDVHGIARMTTPGGGDVGRGICPGFYRVEITKDSEKIPARYNIETTLGQEAALDAANMVHGMVKFDLKY